MIHVVSYSGGIGSWAAAKRVAERHGTENLWLVFTDTLIEDEDLYRFLIEGAADIYGLPRPKTPQACEYPALDDIAARTEFLANLRRSVGDAIPRLLWLAEGRDPWTVFRDRRMIGNTRIDPCSMVLKRHFFDKVMDLFFNQADTTVYIGIDWTEEHRFTSLQPRKAAAGWRYEAPMCEAPFVQKDQMLKGLDEVGIAVPMLYTLGMSHNNCGGFCIKAGQAHFANLLKKLPDRYAYHEAQEEGMRAVLGKDVAIMRDRRGGTSKPLPMKAFRERVQGGAEYDKFEYGGCGCMLVDGEMD